MDEAEQDEYIDTHSMRVIVSYEYTNPTINIPARRKRNRRHSFIVYVPMEHISNPLLLILEKR